MNKNTLSVTNDKQGFLDAVSYLKEQCSKNKFKICHLVITEAHYLDFLVWEIKDTGGINYLVSHAFNGTNTVLELLSRETGIRIENTLRNDRIPDNAIVAVSSDGRLSEPLYVSYSGK